MTFLNPLALFALAAAAIPLIVHLFNFRRPRRVEFSSLVFLRELERSTMQRVRIQQWLLLFLRTMAIAFLVLSFAQPTLTGRIAGALGDGASSALAVVVDNSLSMETLERSGERFRTARDAAMRIIEEAGPTDEIFVVSTSDGAASRQPLRKAAATEAVAGMQLRPFARSIPSAITEASALLQRSSTGTGDVFVLTDLQRTALEGESDADHPDGMTVALVPVGQRVPSNIAVTQVDVVSRILDVGQPVRVEATIHNYGPDPSDEVLVSAYVDDERVAQAAISLPAEGSVRVPLVLTPRQRGWLQGRVVVEDETFAADNERYFSLLVPERRRLLVVRGGGGAAQHLTLALSPEVSEGRIVFERDVVPASDFSGQSLGQYDAVVLAGMERFSSGEVATIAEYVQNGGGLMIYPGRNADVGSYNEVLARLGAGEIREIVGEPGSATAIAEIASADLEHPLFEGVFEGDREARLEQADVFAVMRYEARGAGEQTVLSLSNGWPLMQEVRAGAGSVLLFASALDPEWTELSVRGLFVPLLYRSLFYLSASETEMGDGMALSAEANVRLAERPGGGTIRAVRPDGEEFVPEQRRVFGTRRVVIDGAQVGEPGFVRLVDAETGDLRHLMAVNLDAAESDPALVSGEQAAQTLEDQLDVQVRTISPEGGMAEFGRALSVSRRGVEIWNVFLLIALGFLVAEMLVAKRWRPETAPA